jgi:hypothetical protein
MAKKILSFEEYSKKVDAPDVSEETKDDEVISSEEDVEVELTELPKLAQDYIEQNHAGVEITSIEKEEDDGQVKFDVEFENGIELYFDEEGNLIDDEDEDESDEDEDESDEDEDEDEKTPRSVAEMLKEVYEAAHNEAKAYEGDDYQEHTVESYMKEMAALNAGMMAEMYEASCNEVKEEEMTVEMYEAACNSMKEAYAKKMDEMMESYSSDSNLDSEKEI